MLVRSEQLVAKLREENYKYPLTRFKSKIADINKVHRTIKNIDFLNLRFSALENQLHYYENERDFPLHRDDIDSLHQTFAECEIGLNKAVSCCNHKEFITLTYDDFVTYYITLESQLQRIDKLRMIFMCQD